MIGSLRRLGTSIKVDSPATTRIGSRDVSAPVDAVEPPDFIEAGVKRMQDDPTSGEVVQVQTSSRAASLPNDTVTWDGNALDGTRDFHTRFVARRAECRWAWEGWSKMAPTSSEDIFVKGV